MLIPDDFHALIIGSTGSLGCAFADQLRQDRRCKSLTELSRSSHPGFDLRDPEAFDAVVQTLAAPAALSLIIDASGRLVIDGHRPEKALRELEARRLQQAMDINAIGPMLLIKALFPLLLQRGKVLYVKLSARVGSIEDNRTGGWYGYRASKAALNMMLQCLALEWQRTNPQAQVLALQPGTVRSRLSRDFVQPSMHALSPEESVRRCLAAIDQRTPKPGAQFIDYQGMAIPW